LEFSRPGREGESLWRKEIWTDSPPKGPGERSKNETMKIGMNPFSFFSELVLF
jgi:hypothetical protein